MWQERFERYRDQGFTVIGIALDVEGVAPAKKYYDEFGVTFPALVDPNYATRFGVVPLTFFVDEHGVVQPLEDWESRLRDADELEPVTEADRRRFSTPGQRLDQSAIAALTERLRDDPQQLDTAVELGSRYLDLNLKSAAREILTEAVNHYEPRAIALSDDEPTRVLLANAHLQLSRASDSRDARVHHATLSYYLNPTVGFAKQIARIIAPEKFDDRPDGRFDNEFREATRRRLEQERRDWLTP